MKPIVLTTALSVLLAFNASAEGYKVEYKDINTQWGTKTKIFVTSLFDFTTLVHECHSYLSDHSDFDRTGVSRRFDSSDIGAGRSFRSYSFSQCLCRLLCSIDRRR